MSPVPEQPVIDPKATPDELVSEIDQIRIRLGNTIDELVDRANPKNMARRKVADVRAHFIAPDGSVRVENVVPIVAGAIAVVGAISVLRRILR